VKVLGIVCSPRKGGNTEIMVREALEAAKTDGAETEMVLLSGKNISPCDGCEACNQTGVCHIKDDMQGIHEQMKKADGIILGTPVYFANVSAQAKIVMDRTEAFLRSRALRGKVGGALVVARRVGAGQVLSMLYTFFAAQRMTIAAGGIGFGRAKGDVMTGVGGAGGLSAVDEARAVGKSVVWMVNRLEKGKG